MQFEALHKRIENILSNKRNYNSSHTHKKKVYLQCDDEMHNPYLYIPTQKSHSTKNKHKTKKKV